MKLYRIVFIVTAMAVATAVLSCSSPAPRPNRPPVISQIAGSTDWSPGTEDQVACLASDPDGDELTYRWTADNGTIRGEGDKITWVAPDKMGKYNITVTVTDSKGLETSVTKEVRVSMNADGTITPDAPVVLNLTLPSQEVVTAAKRIRIWTSSPVECRVEGAEGKKLIYKWTTSAGKLQAKGLDDGTASRVTWIAPGAGGDYTLDVVVTDENGNSARGRVNFNVFCCGN